MNINAKNILDDTGYGAFVIGIMVFCAIYKRNESIRYLLVVEVVWGNLPLEVMGGSAIKSIRIRDRTVCASIQISNKVIDPL